MNSNWSYSPETVKLGCDLCDLDLWPLALALCMDITFVIGDNSWKFHDDTMMGTWWKSVTDGRTDGQTDRQTDRQTDWTIHRAAWSQLKRKFNHQYHVWFTWQYITNGLSYRMMFIAANEEGILLHLMMFVSLYSNALREFQYVQIWFIQ